MRGHAYASLNIKTLGVNRHSDHTLAVADVFKYRGDAAVCGVLDPRLIAQTKQNLTREKKSLLRTTRYNDLIRVTPYGA
jgi:hypothetical protein